MDRKDDLFMKKLLTTAVCLAMTFTLNGCGGNKSVSMVEDVSKVPDTPYEINWYTRGPSQFDVATVEAKVNEYLKDKINATLKLNILDAAQYTKKLTTMIAAGESFDLAFSGSGIIDYADSVRNNALFDMAKYIDEYLPKTKSKFDKDFFDSAYVDGKIGGIPALKEYGAEWGWIYRTDLAEKYGIDMSKMKTLEDLEPYLLKIKQGEPDIEYPMEWDTGTSPQNLLSYSMPVTDCVIYLDDGVPRKNIEIFPDTKEFRELCRTTRRYFLEGLVKKDVLTASDATERFKNGKAFVTISSLKPGAYKEKFPDIKYPIDQQPFSVVTQNKANSSLIVLSATSKNPYRAMRFLELLYNESELANLIVFGVEGVHYNKLDDKYVRQIEGSGYNMYKYQWMLGNIFLSHLREGEEIDKHESYMEFNRRAVPNVVNKFYPDYTEYEVEKVAVDGVKAQYRNQATLGALDPDAIIDEYIAKLKEAGIDTIIEKVQAQYDKFLKEQK